MALVYVTGISGAGKSAVMRELLTRGYEAHGTDEAGISAWYHIASGRQVKRPSGEAGRTPEWYAEHAWRMSGERIADLSRRGKATTVFVCGTAANEVEVWEHFNKVIYLDIDEPTLRQRLATRTDNDFGRAPNELIAILGWHKTGRQDYERFGAAIIDATKPLEIVVDRVLAVAFG